MTIIQQFANKRFVSYTQHTYTTKLLLHKLLYIKNKLYEEIKKKLLLLEYETKMNIYYDGNYKIYLPVTTSEINIVKIEFIDKK